MPVDLKSVKSSNIHSVGHDPATKQLHVRFKEGGPVYVYDGVGTEHHTKLIGADSIGSHFAAHIKGKFPFKKMEG